MKMELAMEQREKMAEKWSDKIMTLNHGKKNLSLYLFYFSFIIYLFSNYETH